MTSLNVSRAQVRFGFTDQLELIPRHYIYYLLLVELVTQESNSNTYLLHGEIFIKLELLHRLNVIIKLHA